MKRSFFAIFLMASIFSNFSNCMNNNVNAENLENNQADYIDDLIELEDYVSGKLDELRDNPNVDVHTFGNEVRDEIYRRVGEIDAPQGHLQSVENVKQSALDALAIEIELNMHPNNQA